MITRNKYNVGDKVRVKINYKNDKRREVEAIILNIELDIRTDRVKYKIHFEPDEWDKEQGCTGSEGYVDEDNIIELCL